MTKLEKWGLVLMIWGIWINILANHANFDFGRFLGASILGIGTFMFLAGGNSESFISKQ